MSHKLRLSFLATMVACMALLLLPYGTLAASNHSHSIERTLASHGTLKTAMPATLCGTAAEPTVCEFAYIYNTKNQMVPLESSVTFDSNGLMSAGITHTAGDPGDSAITVATAGTYLVTYSVTSLQPSQFAIFVNGSVAPETIHEIGNSLSQNTQSALITVPAGATITLRNHSSLAGTIELYTGIGGTQRGVGGTQPTISAYILLQQI
ncbi:BclA C-terminal domain-containing protein [Dictyobacter aurantiacus]|uniref:BclA C-terminal domain-containing protein n=1 Tax=Dictyobacter aurantiacus TaxID=1936993 RepID=A0A401ZD81_9CHLR|nr:hypothetical protein [Dictyobacter aurantiacus]GCE04805.1 hypothetical protein KDAU_21340 [Dictyobacter aurantiacus]